MSVLTIPKALSQKGDLVIISRKEYEILLEMKKIREFQPTATHKKALAKAEQNLKKGKTLSYDALAKELGITD